jgi:hypothetical protein
MANNIIEQLPLEQLVARINMLRGVFYTITNGSDNIDRGDLRKALASGKPVGQQMAHVDGGGRVTWDDVVRYMSGDRRL